MSEPPTQPPGRSLNISDSVLETVQIGGIAGRDLNLTQVQGGVRTINIFGTVQVEQAPIHTAHPLSQQEYRWRRVLLDKVQQFWIEGVLNKSLHTKALFELGLEKRSELVQKPLSGVEEFASDGADVFPKGITASKVFEDIGAGRTLLILGEPGAGKTVTLLKLAESLITRSENDLSQALPIVMNLSSWAKQRKSISDWLIEELKNIYGASKELGKTWVDQEQLILLLDGLDEVASQYRTDCVKALNQFIETHGLTEIVVCSRIHDYETLSERLKLRSAIYVRPLTSQQINEFLARAGQSLAALRKAIRQNAELQELASSPLMLSIVSLAYQDCAMEALPQAGISESQRKQLMDTYIKRMLVRRGTTQKYTNQQTLHWLIFLGKRMLQTSQTVFLIERMQPGWFQTRIQRIRYCLESGFISALIVGIALWIIDMLNGTWALDSLGSTHILFLTISEPELTVAITAGLIVSFLGDIKTVETLKWSWKEANEAAHIGQIYGAIFGLIFVLTRCLILWVNNELEQYSFVLLMFFFLLFWLVGGFIFGLVRGFRGPEIQTKSVPNQGIWKSVRSGLTVGVILGVIPALYDSLLHIIDWLFWRITTTGHLNSEELFYLLRQLRQGLTSWFFWGLLFALISGVSASIRHCILRLTLYRMGHIPWNYAQFLDSSADRLFLQKVGGGYIFIHRTLLEHFAAMELDQTQISP
ncbi:MAG: NACHT domain-containing protein [Cyanobacteria bacterium P01_H01_bin.26]